MVMWCGASVRRVPDGGRMVSYTPVTDIVRASDKLKVLTGALENVEDGARSCSTAISMRSSSIENAGVLGSQ